MTDNHLKGKQSWKPGNMLNPVPAVMVSVADSKGEKNIITVAWAGTVCTNPPMVSISVRPERHSSCACTDHVAGHAMITWLITH